MTPTEIKSARQQAGLTQAQAAALVHVDRVTWARYEGGVIPMPDTTWALWLHLAGLERIPFNRRAEHDRP